MRVEILTPENIKELCEKPDVTSTLPQLIHHFISLIDRRMDAELMIMEGITYPQHQKLTTGWGTYEETTVLLDYVIMAVWRDIRDSKDRLTIKTAQVALEDVRSFS